MCKSILFLMLIPVQAIQVYSVTSYDFIRALKSPLSDSNAYYSIPSLDSAAKTNFREYYTCSGSETKTSKVCISVIFQDRPVLSHII